MTIMTIVDVLYDQRNTDEKAVSVVESIFFDYIRFNKEWYPLDISIGNVNFIILQLGKVTNRLQS